MLILTRGKVLYSISSVRNSYHFNGWIYFLQMVLEALNICLISTSIKNNTPRTFSPHDYSYMNLTKIK
ncbi:hypothetical protein SAMN05444008_102398 [Cnuella takakiae]|uniref:Uncharacterized protein n=1 Tax=Cnuella takakiae TaxID=1302690 RepID=A0A1M4VVK7_9BACT|nr:hypothetical protein SAMN05444008_102398 [Cnuella takakiae]